jgi:hypothetical protein
MPSCKASTATRASATLRLHRLRRGESGPGNQAATPESSGGEQPALSVSQILSSLCCHPYDDFVDGLQVSGFPPPCHPSYEALAFTSAGTVSR